MPKKEEFLLRLARLEKRLEKFKHIKPQETVWTEKQFIEQAKCR